MIQLISYLRKKWILIVSFLIFGMSLGFFIAWRSTPKYTASISFVLTAGGNSSGLSGLASQFGLDIGLGNGDIFSEDNISGLITSEKVIRTALLSKSSLGTNTLLNVYCEDLKLDKFWSKKIPANLKVFPFPIAQQKISPVQDSLIREVCAMIRKNNLIVSRPDKKQNIFVAEVTSTGEQFTFEFVNQLVKATSDFYIITKTATASRNLKMIEHEADSLRTLLHQGIVNTAAEADKTFNLNPTKQISRTGFQKNQLSVNVLTAAYSEVLKNLEVARITLQKETPLYQIIDSPKIPLIKLKKSKLLFMIGGGILSMFLGIFFLIFSKIIKSISNYK